MLQYLLPRLSPTLYTYLHFDEVPLHDPDDVVPSNSLAFYLNDIKDIIQHYEHEWDVYKTYTNPFEYIHTIVPTKKMCISKYKPLSRSYFKMVEMIHSFGLGLDATVPIQTFHVCEGPGGLKQTI
jgi:hypothetical protein